MNMTIRFAAAAALCSSLTMTACNDKSKSSTDSMEDATFDQVDRMGLPTINTVFNHPNTASFSKTKFNLTGPETDVANYMEQFKTVLGAVANDDPAATAKALLPDELPNKLGSAVSDFSKLDGRKPEDDAVDVALSVVVGSKLAFLHSDNVNANDVPFQAEFPYLANPH
ncbi:MAG: hypothetical protein JWP91_3561 [Fibrobacteres bacterium]|nr:hypothetical protein [Fibrobacterota bacterium]